MLKALTLRDLNSFVDPMLSMPILDSLLVEILFASLAKKTEDGSGNGLPDFALSQAGHALSTC